MKTVFFITMVIVSATSLMFSQQDNSYPSYIDLSINGLHFCHSSNARAILGNDFNITMDKEEPDDSPHYISGEITFTNADRTQLLTISGEDKYTYYHFRVSKIDKESKRTKTLKKIHSFVSGKHIRLGMSENAVKSILGTQRLVVETKGDSTTLWYSNGDNYDLENLESNCGYPGYDGIYVFKNHRLIQFSFGFSM